MIASEQLTFPYDINYETPGLGTLRVLDEGRNPYGPETYADVPFVLTMYTPLYWLLVHALPEVAGQPFVMGRSVALAAMLGAAALILAVPGRRSRALDALAIGWFCLLWVVTSHSAYLRADSLALLCSAASVTVLARAGGRSRRLAASALLALLAVGCNQSYVAAAVAGLAYLLAADRRGARLYAVVLAAGALAGAVAASLLWGRGFWFCTLDAPRGPYELSVFALAWRSALQQPAFALLALLGLALAVLALLRERGAALRASPYLLYALSSLGLLLAKVGKTGASDIYFLEPALALLLWLTHDFGRHGARRFGRAGTALAATLAFAVAAQDLSQVSLPANMRGGDVSQGRRDFVESHRAAARTRLDQLGLRDPLLLNLASPRYVGVLGERVCINDPFLYEQLWRRGKLDLAMLESAIARQAFDLVLLSPRVELAPELPQSAASPTTALATEARLARALQRSYRSIARDSLASYLVRN